MGKYIGKEYNRYMSWLNVLKTNEFYQSRVKSIVSEYNKYELASLENGLSNSRYEETRIIYKVGTVAESIEFAAKEFSKEKICILLEDRYRSGMINFEEGDSNQPAEVCALSGLYPVLDTYKKIYRNHDKVHIKYPFGQKDGIYCKNIPFMLTSGDTLMDVNAMAPLMFDYCMARKISISEYLDKYNELLKIAYLVPAINGCDILVMNDWGHYSGMQSFVVGEHVSRLVTDVYKGLYKSVIVQLNTQKQFEDFKYGFINSNK